MWLLQASSSIHLWWLCVLSEICPGLSESLNYLRTELAIEFLVRASTLQKPPSFCAKITEIPNASGKFPQNSHYPQNPQGSPGNPKSSESSQEYFPKITETTHRIFEVSCPWIARSACLELSFRIQARKTRCIISAHVLRVDSRSCITRNFSGCEQCTLHEASSHR